MERLELKERYRSKYGQQMSYNYLMIYERSSEEAPTNPRPKKVHQNLRTIKIGLENLDNDMRDYIHYHLPSLQTIEITDPGVRLKVGPIHKTMEHQEDETRRSCPSATCIIWDGITINSKCAFDRRFSVWFSELKKVEFKNCDFDGLWKKGHGNIKIDLEHLYLDELSLGITSTLKKYEPSRRTAIELTVKDQQEESGGADTFSFVRNGAKWKPTSLFERKTSVVYDRKADMRKYSNLYTCIYIIIGSLKKLQLYSPNLFSQTFFIQ